MLNNEVLQKLQDLLASDQKFVSKIETIESVDELHKLLVEQGIDITMEETLDFCKNLDSREEEELDENALDNVAGGFAVSLLVKKIRDIIIRNTLPIGGPIKPLGSGPISKK